MLERLSRIGTTQPLSLSSFGRYGRRSLVWVPFLLLATLPAAAQARHTDPINLDPRVRDAQTHFYNLDYEGALSRFEAIQREHPDNAMAVGYVLTVVIFRELYNQDLLDTTYYAHDSFLTTKRDGGCRRGHAPADRGAYEPGHRAGRSADQGQSE